MFQKKIDGMFSGMPNVFSIPDDILIAGFNEQHKTLMKHKKSTLCMQIHNLKFNKVRYLFRCASIPFFGEVI